MTFLLQVAGIPYYMARAYNIPVNIWLRVAALPALYAVLEPEVKLRGKSGIEESNA